MKTKGRFVSVTGLCHSLLLSLSGVYCLVTAFCFTEQISAFWVIAGISLWTALAAVLAPRKQGGWWLLALWVLAAMLTARIDTLSSQLEGLIYRLSTFYNSAYGWGTVYWSETAPAETNITWGILLLGFAGSTGILWGLSRPGWLWASLAGSLLPLALCCVVTDTVPAPLCLGLLLAGLILLLLTRHSRRHSRAQGTRLTALLLIPVLLSSWLLFSLVTPENYVNQSAPLHRLMQQLLSGGEGTPLPVPGFDASSLPYMTMDLTTVGPKQQQTNAVMDVLSGSFQRLYLRGQALDVYDGLSWYASTEETPDPYWPTSLLTKTLSISTRSPQPFRYVPYYGKDMGNTQRYGLSPWQMDVSSSYTASYHVPSFSYNVHSLATSLDEAQRYLSLPESTRSGAQTILESLNLEGLSMSRKAEIIRDFVEHSARYSLDTPRMPQNEPDFALWFLEDSDTGYCTHYATAAAVLLRAAGIPARYVTGYMVDPVAGVRTTVTAKDAHAWVEYLDEDLYWKVLEATAGYVLEPEDTQPPTTQPSTPPTTQPTAPSTTQATQSPTQSTRPSATAPANTSTKPTETAPVPDEPQAQARLLPYLLWILCAAALFVMIGGQYWLRRGLRRRKMIAGTINQQALTRWRYARLLEKLLRLTTDPRLAALAEKAKFSQHLLTAEELAEFDRWLEYAHAQLRLRRLPVRLLLQLIFALDN